MGKDKELKDNLKITGYVKSNNIISSKSFYKPDLIFVDNKSIIIVESSSNGDRKSHIAELTQFLTFVMNSDYDEYYFLIDLCCKSKSAPNVEKEIQRLQYYYDTFFINAIKRNRIKKIAIADNINSYNVLSLMQIQKMDGLKL